MAATRWNEVQIRLGTFSTSYRNVLVEMLKGRLSISIDGDSRQHPSSVSHLLDLEVKGSGLGLLGHLEMTLLDD
jgi:hypothetical protein